VSEEGQSLLRKGEQSIQAAELLLQQGFTSFAASRAYYAMFYAAEALLLSKGLSFSRHSAVIAAFGEHFAKTRLLPPKLHRYLIQGFEERQVGDYGTEVEISSRAAELAIQPARKFLAVATDYLREGVP